MGVVEEFAKSDDIGWDVSDENHSQMDQEIKLGKFPDVVMAVTHDKTMLYKKKYVKIKVVNEKANGSPTE